MLDAYIIDRIRREREREREEGAFVPLRIDVPADNSPPRNPPSAHEDAEPQQDRGSIIIDFNL